LGVVLPWVGVEWAWTEEGKLVPLRKTLEIWRECVDTKYMKSANNWISCRSDNLIWTFVIINCRQPSYC
jgi:hypothetical protein